LRRQSRRSKRGHVVARACFVNGLADFFTTSKPALDVR
jgi:hypothetical protein